MRRWLTSARTPWHRSLRPSQLASLLWLGRLLVPSSAPTVAQTPQAKPTTDAIAAEREATQEQRRYEDRVALRALATECRFNAATLRKNRDYRPDPRFAVPLRQVALDAATSALAELPASVREDVSPVLQDVLWFNQLVTTRMSLVDISTGDTVARDLMTELHGVGTALPPRLDTVADSLDAATRSGSWTAVIYKLPAM